MYKYNPSEDPTRSTLDILRIAPNTRRKLEALQEGHGDSLEYLANRYTSGVSCRAIGRELGISDGTVASILRKYGVTLLNKSEAVSQSLSKSRQDPNFRERQAEAVRKNWQDQDFRQRNAKGVRKNWQDPNFRNRQADASRKALARSKKDPNFIRKQVDAIRHTRFNPDNLGRYTLPTLFGNRKDVGFAQSAWEANVARVLKLLGREFYQHEQMCIGFSKPEAIQDSRPMSKAFDIDFVVVNNRGKIVCYEIVAPPYKDAEKSSKIELLRTQHPEIDLRLITPKFYRRLQKRFENRINDDSNFAGWETSNSNLKTDPDRFGQAESD